MSNGDSRARSRGVRLFVRDILLIVLAAIVISFLLKTFLIRSFYIPSPSMQNTLLVNDRIIVNELEPRLIPISRGDVVVFADPGGWLPAAAPDTRNDFQKTTDAVLGFIGLTAPDSKQHLVKRVIGLPGDEVTCCGNSGTLMVNGVPLDEPYIQVPSADSDAAPSTFDVTVPAGDLWVMGDNRYDSDDSLAHNIKGDANDGFLAESTVVGRAFVISWPASRWTWLDNYPTTFHGTDPDSKSFHRHAIVRVQRVRARIAAPSNCPLTPVVRRPDRHKWATRQLPDRARPQPPSECFLNVNCPGRSLEE